MKHVFLAIVVGFALTVALLLVIRGCTRLSDEAVEQINTQYLRETYQQPCMLNDGQCGKYPSASPERAKCLIECIQRLHRADQDFEQQLKEGLK
jgi:hypothetical protein